MVTKGNWLQINRWSHANCHPRYIGDDSAFIQFCGKANIGVHYNAWADLGKGDFAPVVTAFRALVASFECPTCEQMYSVTPERGPKRGVRCHCGALNLNLVAK